MSDVLDDVIKSMRTDSAFRRALQAFVSSEQISTHYPTNAALYNWFKVTGSLMANTASTIEMPDVDLSATCDLKLLKDRIDIIEADQIGYYRVI